MQVTGFGMTTLPRVNLSNGYLLNNPKWTRYLKMAKLKDFTNPKTPPKEKYKECHFNKTEKICVYRDPRLLLTSEFSISILGRLITSFSSSQTKRVPAGGEFDESRKN